MWAVDLALERPMPPDVGAFRDIAMVRRWQELFLELADVAALEDAANLRDTAGV